jgi:biopolymer transport protein ExbD
MGESNQTGPGKPQMGIIFFQRRNRLTDIRINMIPMINFALLLLIFFKLSAFYAPRPRRMEITLPTRYETLNPWPIPEVKLLRLFVDEYDSFYYQIENRMDRPEKVDFNRLAKTIAFISREVEDPVMLLKLDPRASYNSMVKIIDKIQSVERKINKKRETVWLKNRIPYGKSFHARLVLRDMSSGDEMLLDLARDERRN